MSSTTVGRESIQEPQLDSKAVSTENPARVRLRLFSVNSLISNGHNWVVSCSLSTFDGNKN